MEKKNNNKITKTFVKGVVVAFCLIQAVCLSACNGIKNFVQYTYEPPKYTDPSNKNPTTKPQQTPSDSQTPSDTETPELPDTPDVPVTPDVPDEPIIPEVPDVPVEIEKTEDEYKADCLAKLEEIALLAAQKGNLEETISNVQDLVYNVADGTLHFHADATGQTRPVNYYYRVYTNKVLEGETYKEAFETFSDIVNHLKDEASEEQYNIERSRRNALKGLVDPVDPEKYEALCDLIEERCGEGSKVLWVNPFIKVGNEARAEFRVISNGKVYVGQSNVQGVTKVLIPPKYVDFVLDNPDQFFLELEEPTAVDYLSFDDIGKEAEEEMGLLNKPKQILKQGANGKWVLDFDFGLGGL